MITAMKRFLILGAAAALVACSSDDSSSSAIDSGGSDGQQANPDGAVVDPGDSNGPDTAVVPPGPVYGAKCTGLDANEQKATDDVAIIRGKAKLPAMDCVDTITVAARAHSKYIQLNGGTLTHVETMGNPGFTGVNFWDRMTAAGFSGSPSYEVVNSVSDADQAILGEESWMDTVYHRIPFMAYETKGFGFGAATAVSTTDFSRGNKGALTDVTTWPANGDTNVWTLFHAAYETPDPVPGHAVVGYPVSISGGADLTLATHDISDGSGAAVTHILMDHANDPIGFVPTTQVFLIPTNPLSPNTKYTVHVTGTLGSAPLDLTVSFTTGAS
jgi:uncharacterized protein YkwD